MAISSSVSIGPSSKEGGATKSSGRSGGLKTVSVSSLGLKLSKKVVSTSEDLTVKVAVVVVVGCEEKEW